MLKNPFDKIVKIVKAIYYNNEWILCLTIAAILELYTAFRIPNEMEKEK